MHTLSPSREPHAGVVMLRGAYQLDSEAAQSTDTPAARSSGDALSCTQPWGRDPGERTSSPRVPKCSVLDPCRLEPSRRQPHGRLVWEYEVPEFLSGSDFPGAPAACRQPSRRPPAPLCAMPCAGICPNVVNSRGRLCSRAACSDGRGWVCVHTCSQAHTHPHTLPGESRQAATFGVIQRDTDASQGRGHAG